MPIRLTAHLTAISVLLLLCPVGAHGLERSATGSELPMLMSPGLATSETSALSNPASNILAKGFTIPTQVTKTGLPPQGSDSSPEPPKGLASGSEPQPAQAIVIPIEPVTDAAEPTILLRTNLGVGAAAFRIGPEIMIVLDTPIEFQARGAYLEPTFAKLSSRHTQDATVIRIPLGPNTLRLVREPRGWLITAGPPGDGITNIYPQLIKTGSNAAIVRLGMAAASRVVVVMNPQTGERLLVGTQNVAGQAVTIEQSLDQFRLIPTLQGVAVAAASDDVWLHRDNDGFLLSAGSHTDNVAVAPSEVKEPNSPPSTSTPKLFNFTNEPIEVLRHRLGERMQAVSATSSPNRSAPRLRLAETMVALGLDVEALTVLAIAGADDPAVLSVPRAIGLRGIAAILAGRLDDAAILSDPRLGGTTEIELWRALLQVAKGQPSPKDAHSLFSGMSVLLAYPRSLRDRLLPGALEAMATNGEAQMAQATLRALPDDRDLDLARGMVFEATDQATAALHIYDDVAARSARLPRYKALVRAAELRMKMGELDATAGADILDRTLFGWRESKYEIPLRLRIAELRKQAGQWKGALGVLRDGRLAFPEERARLDPAAAAIFSAMLDDETTRQMPTTAFVTLFDQNLDIVRDMQLTEPVGLQLVDRLDQLDMLGRAQPVMVRLVAQSTDPARRANLGARLASLRLTLNDATGAIAALSATVPPTNTPPEPNLRETRELLYARAESQRGNDDVALSMLNTLGTAEADEVRANIYIARGDWGKTVAALTALERKRISSGPLTNEQQAIVMLLTVAATRGGDQMTLDRVAGQYAAAMATGSSAPLFLLLTSPPVRGIGDLPRAIEEIQQLSKLPASLAAAGRS